MKFYYRFSFLLLSFLSVFAVSVFGQTITIGAVDAGPYAPGSSIAVPITVNTSGGCTTSATTYKLYLSDAAGSFASRVQIGQFNSFYATFVNGTIPSTGITPGGNYKVLVESSSPTITSAPVAVNIVAGTAVTAGILGSAINTSNPEVYGKCSGSAGYGFIFDNSTSTIGSTVTATFHDEYAPNATADVNMSVAPNGTFTAAATNYTIFVKATKGGITGTKACMLINNVVNTNFGTSGTTSICQGSSLTFTVDITSPTGIQKNFPGNTYNVTWGDGSTHAYTFCEISAAGGTITHAYTTSSCGKTSNGQNNVFEVDLLPKSPYCTSIANPVTSYAKVSAPPSNSFSSNTNGGVTCTGNTVSFSNNSYPGEDPNSVSSSNCSFAGAAYAWYVDGALIKANTSLSTAFTYQFTTTGTHTVTLRLQNNPSTCTVADYTQVICVQDSPTPSFTVPSSTLCLSGGTATIIPATTFTINTTCYTNPCKWTLKNGTTTVATSTSTTPTFTVNAAGIYTLDLGVTDACGTVKNAPQQQIVVNASPTATFAKTAQTYCGIQILTFNNTTGSNTQITYTGTADASGTYVWTVTPSGGAAAATFVSPSTATSQYPQIRFPGVGSYTVSVQYTNSCGVTTSNTETITIQQAPAVVANANPSETICASAGTFQTAGSISDMTNVTSYKWLTTGDGTFTPSAASSSLTPVYNLGPNDLKGGTIAITLDVTTNLVGSCADIKQSFNLVITPADKFSPANTTAASGEICSGNHFNYTIKTANTGASYNRTATVQTGTVTGFSASGSGSVINDDPVNTSATTDAVVVYTITSTSNGCPSTLTYTLTVHPNPVLTATNNAASICSGGQTAISLSATPAGTKYTWTVNGTPGAAGFSAQATAITTANIAQTLTNTSSAAATVTYIITPISAAGCPGTPATIVVTVNPATSTANAGTSATLCNITTYTLNGNVPAVGTGKWTSNQPVTFADDTNPTTVVNGLVPGTTYQFTWTITSACGTSAPSTITITDNAASAGGTASAAINPVCYGSNGIISLTGQTGNITAWQRSTDGGTTWTTIPGTNTNTTYNYTNLTQNTSFRAMVVNGNCSIASSAPVAVGVSPLTTAPDAGPDQLLCNQSVTTLRSGNNAINGQWSGDPSNAPGAVITSPTSLTTTVTGLQGGKTYKFIWTVTGAAPCSNLPDDMTITNLAPITNNTVGVTNNATIVCAGAAVTLNGGAPTGGNGSFAYVWESSTDNGSTWTIIQQATQSITIGVGQKTAFRRTVNSGSCSDISTPITIDISAPVSNNTLPISAQTCYNTIPGLITGSQPNGGDGVNFIYQWQRSSNANTDFTDITGATGKNYQPTQALTADVYYRRVVSTTFCNGAAGNTSQPIHIIVIPDVIAKFTATTSVSCAPFNITSANISATADVNAGTYTWVAILAGGATSTIGTGLTFPGYTIPADGTTVSIKLIVTSAAGCKDDAISMDFSTIKNTSFTGVNVSGSNCGPLTYKFTNTTNATVNTTYVWDFGDGTKYTGLTPPNHTFQPDATGNDANYTVTLTAGNCTGTVSSQKITVYPAAPKAYIDPGASTGCAPYTITVKNITPGTNSSYVFTLYDETNRLVQTITKTNNDKSDAVFASVNTINTVTYTVRMATTNLCGTITQSAIVPIVITSTGISARMAVSPTTNTGIIAGCAPFLASFQNLSTGGNSYVYNIYDANFNPIKSIPTTGNISYNFDAAGTYYVSIGVFSSCTAGSESPKTKITVYPVAAPAFAATTATTGCTQLTVSFENTTPNISSTAPASSFIYTWDFGDGSPTFTGFTPPAHTYDYKKSPYTVTLSVVNTNGCFSSTNRAGYIVVNPPPQTNFTALPDTITTIPNYTFAFVDKTQNQPASWRWDFGDGTTSNRQNPTHTYADTGRYKVTLSTITQFGCTDSKTHIVQVAGVPGQLYIPNAFMPTSLSQELRVFTVKGSGIKNWSLRIMNNWGQVVFETTKLSSKGEPLEFWDGKYKGQDAPQGVYAWEVSAQFINGTDWRGMSYKGSAPKRAGTLTLIR